MKFAVTQISIGHEHRQVGARLRELTDRGAEVDDTSRLGGRDRRIGKIEFRLVALGFGLRKACDGAVALRLQRLDLPLGEFEVRLRALQRGLLLMQLRGVLLGVLNGAVAGLLQVLVALRLLLCEHQRRLGLIDLRLVGADLCLLHVELRVDVLDAGPRGRHLRLRLFERDAIVAVVDAGDHVARGDMLVIGDRHGGDDSRTPSGRGEICRAAMKASSVD